MGFLDTVMKMVKGGAGGKLGGLGGTELSGVVNGLIGKGGTELPALLEKFRAGGLSKLTDSWVGKGANLPVSPDQLKSVLGSDALSGIAAKLGISNDQAAKKVAAALPAIVDKVTPDGSVPDAQTLSKNVGGLLK